MDDLQRKMPIIKEELPKTQIMDPPAYMNIKLEPKSSDSADQNLKNVNPYNQIKSEPEVEEIKQMDEEKNELPDQVISNISADYEGVQREFFLKSCLDILESSSDDEDLLLLVLLESNKKKNKYNTDERMPEAEWVNEDWVADEKILMDGDLAARRPNRAPPFEEVDNILSLA